MLSQISSGLGPDHGRDGREVRLFEFASQAGKLEVRIAVAVVENFARYDAEIWLDGNKIGESSEESSVEQATRNAASGARFYTTPPTH